MASVWEHSFIPTLSSLQRCERSACECSHSVAVSATGSTIPAPWAHGTTMLSRDCHAPVAQALPLLTPWALCYIKQCIFVSNLALLLPTLGKGREENFCGEMESRQMESAWGPGTLRDSLLSHRNNSRSQAKARTGSGRKGSSKSLMRCAQAVHGHAQTATNCQKPCFLWDVAWVDFPYFKHSYDAFSELFICKTRKHCFILSFRG